MILLRSALFNAWFFGATFLLGLLGVFVRWLAPGRCSAWRSSGRAPCCAAHA